MLAAPRVRHRYRYALEQFKMHVKLDRLVPLVLEQRPGHLGNVRKGPWKLIGKGKSPRTLVNLTKDIAEKQNHLKDQPESVKELMRLHVQWIESVGGR